MRRIFVPVVALFALATVLSGCGGDSSAGQQPAPSPGASPVAGRGEVVSPARQEKGLTFTLSSPRSSYRRGEEIPLTLTVTNTTSQTINTYFRNPKQAAIGYYEESGKFVDLNAYVGQSVEESVTYEPGQSRQYPLTVLGEEDEYYKEWRRAAGRYQFVGWLVGSTSDDFFTPTFTPSPQPSEAPGGTISILRSERLVLEVTE